MSFGKGNLNLYLDVTSYLKALTNDTYNRVNPTEGLIDWGTGVERMYSDAKVDHKHFDTQINWKNLKKQ